MEHLRTWLLTTGAILIAGLFSLHLEAEAPPPPAAKSPTAPALSETDPFIKKDTPAPVVETGPAYNVILTVETYNLSQSDGAKLIQENTTDEARYDRLLALEKEGKAHLDMVMSGAQSPNVSSVIEQILIFRYAVAWDIIYGKSKGTDYKTRQTGYRLTFKADPVSDQKTGKLSIFFEHTRLTDGLISTSIRAAMPSFRALSLSPRVLQDQFHATGTDQRQLRSDRGFLDADHLARGRDHLNRHPLGDGDDRRGVVGKTARRENKNQGDRERTTTE